jgi:hypothetical protein
MFRRLAIGAGAIAISAATTPAAFAQLASQNSIFQGTVPPVCQVADAVQPTTPLSYLNNQLTGVTNPFSFQSNGNVSLQLRQVEVLAAPAGTNAYQYRLGLNVNNGAELLAADSAAGSGPVNYPNGLTANDDFTMSMAVSAPGNSLMAQGAYQIRGTVDCVIAN